MDFKEGASQFGKSLVRWVKRIFILAFVLFLAYFSFLLFANFSEGARTGYVVKISKRGVLFKTNEGELNFGFPQLNTTPGMSSQNIWTFSVPNDDVALQIQKAAESGQKVTLFYKQKYKQFFFWGDTDYLVYKIEKSAENVSPTNPTTK